MSDVDVRPEEKAAAVCGCQGQRFEMRRARQLSDDWQWHLSRMTSQKKCVLECVICAVHLSRDPCARCTLQMERAGSTANGNVLFSNLSTKTFSIEQETACRL
ncbi:hypothetical protein HN011_012534 [Eciton burchellii]|nr:hypothetical protein HN011_012534 [Eciton burchellii]